MNITNATNIDDVARNMARELFGDCKQGLYAKIGIDEVRAAIAAREAAGLGLNAHSRYQLETMVLRRIIEMVG